MIQERIYRIAGELNVVVGDEPSNVEFAALVDRLASL